MVFNYAKQFKVIYCKHSLDQSVDDCIIEQLGNGNERQYFVCSQDLELRRRVRLLDNVPIMYFGPDQRITMEDIHKKSMMYLQNTIKDKLLP